MYLTLTVSTNIEDTMSPAEDGTAILLGYLRAQS